jgi:hypothetical protein
MENRIIAGWSNSELICAIAKKLHVYATLDDDYESGEVFGVYVGKDYSRKVLAVRNADDCCFSEDISGAIYLVQDVSGMPINTTTDIIKAVWVGSGMIPEDYDPKEFLPKADPNRFSVLDAKGNVSKNGLFLAIKGSYFKTLSVTEKISYLQDVFSDIPQTLIDTLGLLTRSEDIDILAYEYISKVCKRNLAI